MALVTVQRSPSPCVEQDQDTTDSSCDVADGRSQMRKRSRTLKQKLRRVVSSVRFISKLIRPGLSQSYFAVKGAALILPHTEFTRKSARKCHGGEIQHHLQAMLHLLRPEDTIKIAVRLEDVNNCQRYMALVSTQGRQDTEEAVILGIDCSDSLASIGLVLPVWMGLLITLGGDGGFSVCTDEQRYLFKPVSVQAMWSAIQSLVKLQHVADDMKYIRDGLTHTWVEYYKSRIDRTDSARVSQWNVEGVEVFAPSSLSVMSDDSNERTKSAISQTLKEVMMTVDLDEATSLTLRKAVEEKMKMSLTEFKGYFDEEVMRILGQMDEPSEILDFLYLGSEWNASNLDELLEKGIDYILNVTKEIDNFFEGRFHYYNVRVYDLDDSDLLKHWDKTYKFISKARSQRSKVLVHCKMGVSRSASTVMAFLMKDRRWSVEEAFSFVKEKRSCVHPNAGFMEQLYMYQGILTASNKRDMFRSKSDQNLLDEGAKDVLQPSEMSFLGGDLFHTMSHSDWLLASGGVAHGEEWIGSLYQDQLYDADILHVDTDFDTESRSADSIEEVLPDLPSPSEPVAHEYIIPLSEASPSSTGPSLSVISESSTGPSLSPSLSVSRTGPSLSIMSVSSTGPSLSVSSVSNTGPSLSVMSVSSTGPSLSVTSVSSTGPPLSVTSVSSTGPPLSLTSVLSTGPPLSVTSVSSTGPPLSVMSVPSTEPSLERSSCDMDVAHETKADETCSSIENVSYQQTTVGSPTSRIKSDSSWIRLDIVGGNDESDGSEGSHDGSDGNKGSHDRIELPASSVPYSESHSCTDFPGGTLMVSVPDHHRADLHMAAITEPHGTAIDSFKTPTEPHGTAIDFYKTPTEPHGTAIDSYKTSTLPHGTANDQFKTPTEPHGTAIDSYKTPTEPHGTAIDSYKTPTVPHGTANDPYKTPTELQGTAIDFYKTPTEPHGTAIDSNKTPSEPHGTAIDSYKAPTEPHGAAIDSYKTPTEPHGTYVDSCTAPTEPHDTTLKCDFEIICQQRASIGIDKTSTNIDQVSMDISSQYSHFIVNSGEPPQTSAVSATTVSEPLPCLPPSSTDLTSCSSDTSLVDMTNTRADFYIGDSQISYNSTQTISSNNSSYSSHTQTLISSPDMASCSDVTSSPGVVSNPGVAFSPDLASNPDVTYSPDVTSSPGVTSNEEVISQKPRGQQKEAVTYESLADTVTASELVESSFQKMPIQLQQAQVDLNQCPHATLDDASEVLQRAIDCNGSSCIDTSVHNRIELNAQQDLVLESIPGTSGQVQQRRDETINADETLQDEEPDDNKVVDMFQVTRTLKTSSELDQESESTKKSGGVATTSGSGESQPGTQQFSNSGSSQANIQASESYSAANNILSQQHLVLCDKATGNIDSKTLALIREIGSALSMSPILQQPGDDSVESPPHSNLVRYFVRKIEQQTKMTNPTQKKYKKTGSLEIDGSKKVVSADQGARQDESLNSPAKLSQQVDPKSVCTAQPSRCFSISSRTAQGVPDTSCQDWTTPDRTSLDADAGSHSLLHMPSAPIFQCQHEVSAPALPLTTEERVTASTPDTSCSPNYTLPLTPTLPSEVPHPAGMLKPKNPEMNSSESTFVQCDRLKDDLVGSSSIRSGNETSQKGDGSCSPRSEGGSINARSDETSIYPPADNELSQPFSSSLHSSSTHLLDSPGEMTCSDASQDCKYVITIDSGTVDTESSV